jgi:hypothetical protein
VRSRDLTEGASCAKLLREGLNAAFVSHKRLVYLDSSTVEFERL